MSLKTFGDCQRPPGNIHPNEVGMQWQGQQWKLLERVIHFLFFLFSTIWQRECKKETKKKNAVMLSLTKAV